MGDGIETEKTLYHPAGWSITQNTNWSDNIAQLQNKGWTISTIN